jgi:prepilin-type N-terminal cleavage/methylation domain-containing protein
MPRRDVRRCGAQGARGFTLLEVVVVLVIVSMTSAIVFPRLATMASSYEFASQRDTFEQNLNGLSYQTYRENNDKILQGFYTAAGRDEKARSKQGGVASLAANMRTRPLTSEFREDLAPVTTTYAEIPMPDGWEVVVNDPIYYRGSGYCSGGTIDLFVGRLQYSYMLRPPLCRAELVE